MDNTKQGKLTKAKVDTMKELSDIISSAVLSAYPNLPTDLFNNARYEFHFRGDFRSIKVRFSYETRFAPISLSLSSNLKNPPTISDNRSMNYLRHFDSAKLVKAVNSLSKGYWSKTGDLDVRFIGLSFNADCKELHIYHQSISPCFDGTGNVYNSIITNFEEVLS